VASHAKAAKEVHRAETCTSHLSVAQTPEDIKPHLMFLTSGYTGYCILRMPVSERA